MFNRFTVFTTMLCGAVLLSTANLQAQKSDVKNIVLVHGGWADGSGWRGVYDHLVRDGFKVSIVQEPETCVSRGRRHGNQLLDRCGQTERRIIMSKTWLITGASSGLGRLTTERLLASGDRAVATARREDSLADLQREHCDRPCVTTHMRERS
jgi:hypothetical protein